MDYKVWFLEVVSNSIILLTVSFKIYTSQPQDVNWTYIKRSEDVHDVFWTFYARSIYVLCLWGSDTYLFLIDGNAVERHHQSVLVIYFPREMQVSTHRTLLYETPICPKTYKIPRRFIFCGVYYVCQFNAKSKINIKLIIVFHKCFILKNINMFLLSFMER